MVNLQPRQEYLKVLNRVDLIVKTILYRNEGAYRGMYSLAKILAGQDHDR
jgi:hypothetical protein